MFCYNCFQDIIVPKPSSVRVSTTVTVLQSLNRLQKWRTPPSWILCELLVARLNFDGVVSQRGYKTAFVVSARHAPNTAGDSCRTLPILTSLGLIPVYRRRPEKSLLSPLIYNHYPLPVQSITCCHSLLVIFMTLGIIKLTKTLWPDRPIRP